jgi:uncharacterized protein YijF (DUF1287 family)
MLKRGTFCYGQTMRRPHVFLLSLGSLLFLALAMAFAFASTRNVKALASEITAVTEPPLIVPALFSSHDEDADGINDTQDLLNGAHGEVKRRPTYRSAYYQGGYPPPDEGVCTDVIWRAFKEAGYDLKKLVDDDIAKRTTAYSRVNGAPDQNIDFRRVPNLHVFFKKFATSLTLEIKPGDIENVKEWQGGDIVIFGAPHPHIGIISENRFSNGVPYLLHNAGKALEDNGLTYWNENLSPIEGHFRWPKK